MAVKFFFSPGSPVAIELEIKQTKKIYIVQNLNKLFFSVLFGYFEFFL